MLGWSILADQRARTRSLAPSLYNGEVGKSFGAVGETRFLIVAGMYPTVGKAHPSLKYFTDSRIGAKSERLLSLLRSTGKTLG